MNTIEDFKNAPVGATATHEVWGSRAMKTNKDGWRWVTPRGGYMDDEEMELQGYTLDSSAPATAREALDLAWELAHEVKPWQVIPEGTRYLIFSEFGVKEYTAQRDIKIIPVDETNRRTLDPLPEPEPDWLDAPAVIATTIGNDNHRTFMNVGNSRWRTIGEKSYHWNELRDVTPLYPKEGQDA